MAYLVFPNGRMFRFPELTSSLLDKKAAGFLGAACDDWLLFHDDGGLFCLTSPFTGKTRLLPSFHGVRAHEGPVEIVNEPAPSLRAVTTQWKDDEAMAARKLVMCPDGGFIAAFYGGEHLAKTSSWSHSAGERWRRYDDLVLFGGRLYAVTAGEDLLAFDVGTGEPFVSRVERVVEGDRRCPIAATVRYLVPSDGGDLLMVRRRLMDDGPAQATWLFPTMTSYCE
uniref:KIB1-4 beta-propeller domain-containing protein n=1 Tax=Setaria italica TaxID=4555 RepID=K4AKW7_SETIT